jgi:hypothetical protein
MEHMRPFPDEPWQISFFKDVDGGTMRVYELYPGEWIWMFEFAEPDADPFDGECLLYDSAFAAQVASDQWLASLPRPITPAVVFEAEDGAEGEAG